jgi:hypothetical protein
MQFRIVWVFILVPLCERDKDSCTSTLPLHVVGECHGRDTVSMRFAAGWRTRDKSLAASAIFAWRWRCYVPSNDTPDTPHFHNREDLKSQTARFIFAAVYRRLWETPILLSSEHWE